MDIKKLTPKQQFWNDHLEAQANSGVRRSEYCKLHNLKVDHMYSYGSKLKCQSTQRDNLPDFVKVTPKPAVSSPVLLRIGSNVLLELPPEPMLIGAILGQLR